MPHNILLFTSTFPRRADDPLTPRFVYDLGRELTRYFNVHVLAPHAPGAAREEVLDGMRVLRYRYFFPESLQTLAYGAGIPNNLRTRPFTWLQAPFLFYCQWRALMDAVRRYRIDLVNSHWMLPQGLTAAGACARLGVKHVLTIHSAGLFLLRRIPGGRLWARAIVERCHAVYAVSRHNHRMLEDLVRRPVAVRVLPMGIDTAFYAGGPGPTAARRQLGLPESGPLILYLGKLSRIKGVSYLLRALPDVLRQFPEARLMIVGSGDEEAALKNEAARLKVENRVLWAGQQNREQVRVCLNACDVAALPSIQDANGQVEGFPVAMLEALASGKPVVGTRLGGVAEGITDGHNGLTVPPGDSAALAGGLIRVLEKGPAAYAAAARASVAGFDREAVGRDYRKTFEDLLSD